MNDVTALLHAELAGRSLELRIPEMEGIHPLILDPAARNPENLGATLPLFLLQFVVSADGAPLDLARATRLAADAALMRGVLDRVRSILETLRARGAFFALCPSCGRREVEMPLPDLVRATVGAEPRVFDGPFLALPVLSGELAEPARSAASASRAARIRVETPSMRLGISSPVHSTALARVFDLPEDHPTAPDDEEEEEEFEFSHLGPGWRALLRLSRAVEPTTTAEVLEGLPVIDFFFLDLAYQLRYLAPLGSSAPARLRCPDCGTEFVPV